jgi:hypothetical protein
MKESSSECSRAAKLILRPRDPGNNDENKVKPTRPCELATHFSTPKIKSQVKRGVGVSRLYRRDVRRELDDPNVALALLPNMNCGWNIRCKSGRLGGRDI